MEANTTYYIYNYSVQPEFLFRSERDIVTFLRTLENHLSSVALIKKLLVNDFSFHALITFHDLETLKRHVSIKPFNSTKLISRKLSNCFNAYAQSYNYTYFRKGNLFRKSFKYIELDEDEEFVELIETEISQNNLKVILQ